MLEIRGRKTFWSVKFENMLRLNLQDISRVSIILGTWPVEFLQFNLFQQFENFCCPRFRIYRRSTTNFRIPWKLWQELWTCAKFEDVRVNSQVWNLLRLNRSIIEVSVFVHKANLKSYRSFQYPFFKLFTQFVIDGL